MKKQQIVCNACKTEVPVHSPYPGSVDLPEGWFRIDVMSTLAAPPPPDYAGMLGSAMGEIVGEDGDPRAEKMKTVFCRYAEQMSAITGQAYEPPPMIQQKSAELCPKCGPEFLGRVLPICAGDGPVTMGRPYGIVG